MKIKLMGSNLSDKQLIQENEYVFPYHYLDLMPRFEYMFLTVRSYRKIVIGLLAPYNGSKVLDVGCGDGRLVYELAEYNLNITGVDYSASAIAFAKVFCPRATFLVRDLIKDNIEGKFGKIVLMEVLEHIRSEDISKVMKTLRNCIAENGRLIITVPSKREKLIPKHYRHYNPQELEDAISPYFAIEKMTGHLHTGFRYNLYRLLLKGDCVFGPMRFKLPFIKYYYRIVESLLGSIEITSPEKAARLIAVCRAV
jgi:SAM-dependent methyltransferase